MSKRKQDNSFGDETNLKGQRFNEHSSMAGLRLPTSPNHGEPEPITTDAASSTSSSNNTTQPGVTRTSISKMRAAREKRVKIYHNQMSFLNYEVQDWARRALNGEYGPIPDNAAYFSAVENYLHHSSEIKRRFDRNYGDVAVFGTGDCGQLGCGENILEARTPRILMNLRGCMINMLASGGLHNLALSENGLVYSWGCNDEGSLGANPGEDGGFLPITVSGFHPSQYGPRGDTDLRDAAGKIIPFQQRKEASIVQIAAGASQSLALSTTGDVYMWGNYKDNEGRGFRNMPPNDDTRKKTGLKDMDKLEEDDKIEWFMPPRGNQDWPLHVYQIPIAAKDISAGASFNAALLVDNTITTWGIGTCGELGRDVPHLDKKTPSKQIEESYLKPAPPMWAGPRINRTVLTIACGGYHLMAITRDGDEGLRVYSCGLNNYGQLGHGDTENRGALTKINHFDGCNITKVEGGFHHSYFVDATGKQLYTCGRGDYGQLGITFEQPDEGYFENLPVRVPLVYESQGNVSNPKENSIIEENIKEEDQPVIDQISAGESHALVLTKEGDVYSWGFGECGQVGQGKSDNDVTRPKRLVTKLENANGAKYKMKFVSGGGQHSSAVISTGSSGFQVE